MPKWGCVFQIGLNLGLAKQGSVCLGDLESCLGKGLLRLVAPSLPGGSSAPPSKTPNFLAVLRAVEDELLTPQVSTVLNERCADITQCQRTVGEGLLLEGHKPGDHAQADTVPSAAGHRPPASE